MKPEAKMALGLAEGALFAAVVILIVTKLT